MVKPVDRIVPDFAKAGATYITFHPEASEHVDRTIGLIREHGCKPGLVFNPATPLNWLDYVLDKIDMVLLMSVNPGFGGQSFIPSALPKIAQVRERIDRTRPRRSGSRSTAASRSTTSRASRRRARTRSSRARRSSARRTTARRSAAMRERDRARHVARMRRDRLPAVTVTCAPGGVRASAIPRLRPRRLLRRRPPPRPCSRDAARARCAGTPPTSRPPCP